MSRYASDGGGPLNASREFKEMVKALHGAGIEVSCVFLPSKVKYVLFLVASSFLFVVSLIRILQYLLCQMRFFFFLQVILDVVYNHTNEADDAHPYTTSFRGVDNKVIFHFCCEIFLLIWRCHAPNVLCFGALGCFYAILDGWNVLNFYNICLEIIHGINL